MSNHEPISLVRWWCFDQVAVQNTNYQIRLSFYQNPYNEPTENYFRLVPPSDGSYLASSHEFVRNQLVVGTSHAERTELLRHHQFPTLSTIEVSTNPTMAA